MNLYHHNPTGESVRNFCEGVYFRRWFLLERCSSHSKWPAVCTFALLQILLGRRVIRELILSCCKPRLSLHRFTSYDSLCCFFALGFPFVAKSFVFINLSTAGIILATSMMYFCMSDMQHSPYTETMSNFDFYGSKHIFKHIS